MERELFSKYLKLMEDEEESLQSLATEKMSNYSIDVEHCQDVVVNVSSMGNMRTSSVMENMEAQQLTGLSMCISSTE